MSVLIKGMEMPKSCWLCTLSQLYEKPREMLVCQITHEEVLRNKIDGNCPLVQVPPHGRLIDADALNYSHTDLAGNHLVYLVDIEASPTIIESERQTN